MRSIIWLLALVPFLSCGNRNDSDLQSIYGVDDRKDLFEADQMWQRAARSVVALVKQDKISGNRLIGDTLGTKLNLCETERFRTQPSVAGCSGFLAAPN